MSTYYQQKRKNGISLNTLITSTLQCYKPSNHTVNVIKAYLLFTSNIRADYALPETAINTNTKQ